MCNLIEDLANQNIKVKVEYRYGSDANGDPNLVTYEDTFIKRTLKNAVSDVKDCLHQIFLLQTKAYKLSDAIESVSDRTIDDAEEVLGNYILTRDRSDFETLKRAGKHLNEGLSTLKKEAREYETVCMMTYDDCNLTPGPVSYTHLTLPTTPYV